LTIIILFFKVSWEADSSGNYDYRTIPTGGTEPNFRNLNEFTAADICPY